MDSTSFPLGLTFDDVLLIPGFADFSRSDIDLSTQLTKTIRLSLPFVSAPMDTVTESDVAIALAKLGGIGIIHRNLTIEQQVKEVKHVTSQKLINGAAVGASKGVEDRVKALVKAGADVIVVDSAHGYATGVIKTTQWIKKTYPAVQVIAGNIATADGAKALIDAGADGLRVGMGPGAICTTRIISGMGVPQLTAIIDTVMVAKKAGIPIIADGGIKYSGDMVKALAAGASSVMMGSFFASCEESPGEIVTVTKDTVQTRFKTYRGMGSIGAMQQGAKIKSEDEFHGKSYYKEKVLVAEGVEGLVPVRGRVETAVAQALGGIKSGMYYVGAKTLSELHKNARFMQITQASLKESHPHDIMVTNGGGNY